MNEQKEKWLKAIDEHPIDENQKSIMKMFIEFYFEWFEGENKEINPVEK